MPSKRTTLRVVIRPLIHCPPSARLSELCEDKGSDYAAEGTDARSLCEYKLKAHWV